VGRSDAIRKHWAKNHRDKGPYPNDTSWDTLNDILRDNKITLGQDSAAVPSASAGPSRFPAPPPAQFRGSIWTQAGPATHIPYPIPFQNLMQPRHPQHVTPVPLPPLDYGHYPTNPQYLNHSPTNYPLVRGQAQEYRHSFTPASSIYSPENSQNSQYQATPACDQGPHSPSGGPHPTPYGHELADPSQYPVEPPYLYNNGAYSHHSAHVVHQTITPLRPRSFIGSYSPPFPQHYQGHIFNPHIAYGQPPPYPHAFARPPGPVYTRTSSSRYEQYPEDYLHPRYNSRAHSPTEGSCADSFDGEPADQGTSTNPSPGRDHGYHHDQNSSFNHNHHGI
jgi:hypothetical protein